MQSAMESAMSGRAVANTTHWLRSFTQSTQAFDRCDRQSAHMDVHKSAVNGTKIIFAAELIVHRLD